MGSRVKNLVARNLRTLGLRYIIHYIISNVGRKKYTPFEEKRKRRRTGNVLGKQDLCNKTHRKINLVFYFRY